MKAGDLHQLTLRWPIEHSESKRLSLRESTMNTSDHIVFVIDDDRAVCKSLGRLLRTAGHTTETFGSLTEFLSREFYSGGGCFVLDVCLTEMSGLEARQKL